MGRTADGDATSRAVDLAVLREATGGDRDLMQQLAELYLGDTDLQLRALDDALQNREMDRIRRIGGSLSAASAAVGAELAAAVFGELEAAARAADAERVRRAIERGTAEFQRVRRALAELR